MEARTRLAALVAALLGLGFALVAYESYDPSAERALDATETLPEGTGFAPRPVRVEPTPIRAAGRWLHARLDGLFGGSDAPRRSDRELRVLPSAVTFGPPGGLLVRVRGADGEPASGVAVTVYAPPRAAAPAMRRTDARGETRFERLPSGPGYVVEANGGGTLYGLRPAAFAGVVVAPGVVREVEVSLPSEAVEGVVVDEADAAPVAGARVDVLESPTIEDLGGPRGLVFARSVLPPPRRSVVADDHGRFRIGSLPVGPAFVLRALAGDAREGALWCVAGGAPGTVFRVTVGRPTSVTGLLLDEDDAPVADAVVWASGTERSVRSGPDGRFTLPATGEGHLVVEFAGAMATIPLDIRPGATPVPLRVARTTALDVRVVDESGGPVRDLTVSLWAFDGPRLDGSARRSARARTDADGRARVPVPLRRIGAIWVDGPGGATLVHRMVAGSEGDGDDALSASLREPLRRGEVRALTVRLPRTCSIRGRAVLSDGTPASGARLRGEDAGRGREAPSAIADAEGRFVLSGFDAWPRATPLELSIEGEIEGVVAGRIDLSERLRDAVAGDVDVGDLVLLPGAMFRGRVVGSDGAPVVGATVGCGSGSTGVRTDAHGVFRLTFDPTRRAFVEVVAPGWRVREASVRADFAPGSIRDVEPIVLRRPVALRVRVVDLVDRPVAGVRVRATESWKAESVELAPTDARGVAVGEWRGTSSGGFVRQTERGLAFRSFGSDDETASRGLLLTTSEGFVVDAWLDVPEDAEDPYDVLVRIPARLALAGIVRDERGAPVASTDVKAELDSRDERVHRPHDLACSPYEATRTTTDAEGRYRFVLGGVPGERWIVTAQPDAGPSARGAVRIERDATLDLVLGRDSESDAKGGGGK